MIPSFIKENLRKRYDRFFLKIKATRRPSKDFSTENKYQIGQGDVFYMILLVPFLVMIAYGNYGLCLWLKNIYSRNKQIFKIENLQFSQEHYELAIALILTVGCLGVWWMLLKSIFNLFQQEIVRWDYEKIYIAKIFGKKKTFLFSEMKQYDFHNNVLTLSFKNMQIVKVKLNPKEVGSLDNLFYKLDAVLKKEYQARSV